MYLCGRSRERRGVGRGRGQGEERVCPASAVEDACSDRWARAGRIRLCVCGFHSHGWMLSWETSVPLVPRNPPGTGQRTVSEATTAKRPPPGSYHQRMCLPRQALGLVTQRVSNTEGDRKKSQLCLPVRSPTHTRLHSSAPPTANFEGFYNDHFISKVSLPLF